MLCHRALLTAVSHSRMIRHTLPYIYTIKKDSSKLWWSTVITQLIFPAVLLLAICLQFLSQMNRNKWICNTAINIYLSESVFFCFQASVVVGGYKCNHGNGSCIYDRGFLDVPNTTCSTTSALFKDTEFLVSHDSVKTNTININLSNAVQHKSVYK